MAKNIKVNAKGKTSIVAGMANYGTNPSAGGSLAEDTVDTPRSNEPVGDVEVTTENTGGIVHGYAKYGEGVQVDSTDGKANIKVGGSSTANKGPDKVASWLGKMDNVDMASVASQMTNSTWEQEDINDESDPYNCWLCSIGGRHGIKVSRLLTLTEKRGAATEEEILQMYKENGASPSARKFLDWNDVTDSLQGRLKPNSKLKVLLGYDVTGGSVSHMVVLKAKKTSRDEIQYRVIDFQRSANDPDRITENKLPMYAKGPFLIIETPHDVYSS